MKTRILFLMKAILFTSVLLLCSNCKADDAYTSVTSISESWIEAKISMSIRFQNTEEQSSEKIDVFVERLNRFIASPLGNLYTVHQPDEMDSLKNISILAKLLKTELHEENESEIFPLILEIDRSVNFLQNIDTQLSDTSQRNYFYLFFFFAILIMIIIAAMSMMYRRLEKTEAREKRSIRFSRETVMAQEEERSRIAKELHDTVAQDLWRISFQIDSIGKSEKAEERNRLCTEAVNGQREVMKQVRSICDTLIPPDFARRGLADAIRLFCYNFEQRTKIAATFSCEENLQLGGLESSAQLQCFRIVQECLANIEKHSGATESSISIKTKKSDMLEISIRDNGKGFSPPNRESSQQFKEEGHIGLWSMFERAALLGGNIKIESALGKGSVVQLTVPIFSRVKLGETET
jgi:signal transduction histidine kinase